jgi:hypothetical protein
MSLTQGLRWLALILACGILGGWIWTELAPAPPVNGGILSAAGGLIGIAAGNALHVALMYRDARRDDRRHDAAMNAILRMPVLAEYRRTNHETKEGER